LIVGWPRTLPIDPLNIRPAHREFFLHRLVPSIQGIDAITVRVPRGRG
jgi:hypothetical protein